MDRMQSEAQIREIMAETLDIDPGTISPGFGREDAPLWDSLTHLRLITALEEAFGITMTMQEVNEMTTFEQIQRVVESRR
jgi:acyl carrier protein